MVRPQYKGGRTHKGWTGRVRCLECVYSTSGASASKGRPAALLGQEASRHAARTGHTVELVRTERAVFERIQ